MSVAAGVDAVGAEARAQRHREGTAVLGMGLFVGSWVMLFAALFFAYGVTRARALAWPPADLPRLPLAWPAVATIAIALASAGMHLARKRAQAVRAGVLLGLLGSAVFLAIQLSVWRTLFTAGLTPQSGTYASVFYGLTTFHALHVAVGIIGLGGLLLRPARVIALRLWTIYVHMVGLLWLALFLGVYCL